MGLLSLIDDVSEKYRQEKLSKREEQSHYQCYVNLELHLEGRGPHCEAKSSGVRYYAACALFEYMCWDSPCCYSFGAASEHNLKSEHCGISLGRLEPDYCPKSL